MAGHVRSTTGRKSRECPGPHLEHATYTFLREHSRRRLATSAVALTAVALAATAAGAPTTRPHTPTARPVAAPQVTVATVAVDDRAEARSLQRATRARARAAREAAAAVSAAAQPPAATAPRTARAKPPRVEKKKATAPASRRSTPVHAGRSRRAAPTVAAPGDAGRASVAVRFALAQVGKPYIWASAGPRGYDCSGLMIASFGQVGIRIQHHYSGAIARLGRPVPRGQWAPGDVLYWPGHVALYIGGGKMVHAPGRGRQITVANVYGSPGARRLL